MNIKSFISVVTSLLFTLVASEGIVKAEKTKENNDYSIETTKHHPGSGCYVTDPRCRSEKL